MQQADDLEEAITQEFADKSSHIVMFQHSSLLDSSREGRLSRPVFFSNYLTRISTKYTIPRWALARHGYFSFAHWLFNFKMSLS